MVTKLVEYDGEKIRLYSIVDVHYANRKPSSYAVTEGKHSVKHLVNCDDLEHLKADLQMLGEAFNKPILDLDNWPNVFKDNG